MKATPFGMVGILSLLCLLGCSAGLDWDPTGLPCSESGACESGYSCFLPPGDFPSADLSELRQCIRDASIERGGSCTNDVQCISGLECFEYQCTSQCQGDYYTRNTCEPGEYCLPLFQTNRKGACIQGSGCVDDEDCGSDSICVVIDDRASTCLAQCEISWADDGSYSDNCGSTINSKLTCQPVGPQAVARLACLRSGVGQGVGTQCDLGPQSCDSGAFCLASTNSCKEYCDLDSVDACDDSGTCQAYQIGNQQMLGYCED